ncbi:MAG: hypothetical protein WD470_06550 [Rhodospirillaceae bacterium]
MTRKTTIQGGATELHREDSGEDCDDEIRSVVGFASAICYLAYEAERAGWTDTLECLEEAYNVFLDEVGTERVRFRVYINPERS